MGSDPIAIPALEAIAAGQCDDFCIESVYTQPDRPHGRGQKLAPNEIKSWALAQGIPVHQPAQMKKPERLEIGKRPPDAILVMAYGHLLTEQLIATPLRGIWNLHTSILPRYRGASPIQSAIASGDPETGVSLMRMVRKMDAGPVLDVERVPIGRSDTALDIESRLAIACVPLLARNLPKILAGEADPTPQRDAEATYVRKLRKEDGALDFHQPAPIVAKRVNGLHPWPGTSFPFEGAAIKASLADWEDGRCGEPGGTVLEPAEGALRVACGGGVLRLLRLQRPGARALDAADFLRGFPIRPGSVLASQLMPELVSQSDR